MMRFVSSLLATVMFLQYALVAVPAVATAQTQTSGQPSSPCDDPQFVSLQAKKQDDLSPRELEYLKMKEEQCFEFRKLQLEKSSPSPQAQAATASGPDAMYEACERGKNDGASVGGSVGYGIGGFFCGIFGFIIAAAATPSVPADRIAGKSPDYAAAYTRCYQKEAKGKNMQAACLGWAAGSALALLILANSSSTTG